MTDTPDHAIEPAWFVECTYAPDAAETRVPFRAAHLARAAELKRQGVIIEVGRLRRRVRIGAHHPRGDRGRRARGLPPGRLHAERRLGGAPREGVRPPPARRGGVRPSPGATRRTTAASTSAGVRRRWTAANPGPGDRRVAANVAASASSCAGPLGSGTAAPRAARRFRARTTSGGRSRTIATAGTPAAAARASERPPGVRLDVGRVDDREPPRRSRATTAAVEGRERRPGRRLVRRVAGDQRPERVRGQDLVGREVARRERRLAGPGGPDEHDERWIRDRSMHQRVIGRGDVPHGRPRDDDRAKGAHAEHRDRLVPPRPPPARPPRPDRGARGGRRGDPAVRVRRGAARRPMARPRTGPGSCARASSRWRVARRARGAGSAIASGPARGRRPGARPRARRAARCTSRATRRRTAGAGTARSRGASRADGDRVPPEARPATSTSPTRCASRRRRLHRLPPVPPRMGRRSTGGPCCPRPTGSRRRRRRRPRLGRPRARGPRRPPRTRR